MLNRRQSIKSGINNILLRSDLLLSLIQREIKQKYIGTFFGLIWSIIYPLIMLAVYGIVFGGIFKSRWTPQGEIKEFLIMLFCGLIIHNFFSETLTKAPSAIYSNPNFVKKVVFPLELISLSQMGAAFFNLIIGIFLIIFFLLVQGVLPYTFLLVPIVILPLLFLTSGLAWILSALGVFFRDIDQIINIIMSILLFLSPIFYSLDSVPSKTKLIILMNPLTFPIVELRKVLIIGGLPSFNLGLMYLIISVSIFLLGLYFFQKSKPAFPDVI